MYRNALRLTFWLSLAGLLMSHDLFTAVCMASCLGVCIVLALINVNTRRRRAV